ncbi:helix-turn-helix transcriptional regulator [Micromonospora chersina]|uniref:helix-turn-helix transcriptional regulator n=1 Tax=Micromonospora chersina TaxID=47854 RepID=UPI00340341B2
MEWDVARRDELAAFLRSRRARLRPSDVGLPVGGRRRTAGLRRQEVAQLAGISVDYYIRLEQGRAAHPSRQVLAALARALVLTRTEREYLFRAAGITVPVTGGPSRELAPGLRHLLEAMTETPAYVVDVRYDVLAWNRLATFFLGDLSRTAPTGRNLLRHIFQRPDSDAVWEDPDAVHFTRGAVADLRRAYSRYAGDRGISDLVTELLKASPRFAEMWTDHDVDVRRRIVNRLSHPELGPLEFECQVLHTSELDQKLIVYTAPPGSRTQETFRRLGVPAGSPGER